MGKVVSAEVFLLHRKTVVLATAYGHPAQAVAQKERMRKKKEQSSDEEQGRQEQNREEERSEGAQNSPDFIMRM